MDVAEACYQPHYRLQAGDSIVIEAHEALKKLHLHSVHFALMRTVLDSKPPPTNAFSDVCVRQGLPARAAVCATLYPRLLDAHFLRAPIGVQPCRSRRWLGGIVLILIVVLAAANELVLLQGCICGVIILLAVKSITVEEMFENVQVGAQG